MSSERRTREIVMMIDRVMRRFHSRGGCEHIDGGRSDAMRYSMSRACGQFTLIAEPDGRAGSSDAG